MVRFLFVAGVALALLATWSRSAHAEPFVSTFEIAVPNPLVPLPLFVLPPSSHDLVISYSFSQDDLLDAVIEVDLPPNLILIDVGGTEPFAAYCEPQSNPSVDPFYDWRCELTAARVDLGTGGSGTLVLRVAPAHFAFSDGETLTVSATLSASNLTTPVTATFNTTVDTTTVSPTYQSATNVLDLGSVEKPATGEVGLSSLLVSVVRNLSNSAIGRGVEYRLAIDPAQPTEYVTNLRPGFWTTVNTGWTPVGTVTVRLPTVLGPAFVRVENNGAKGFRGYQDMEAQTEPLVWSPCTGSELLVSEITPSVWAPQTPNNPTLVQLSGGTGPVANTLGSAYNFNCQSGLESPDLTSDEAIAGSSYRVNAGFQLPMGAVPLHDMFIALKVDPTLPYRGFRNSAQSIYLLNPVAIDLSYYACTFTGDVDLARFLLERDTACTLMDGLAPTAAVGTTHLIAHADEYFIDQPYGRVVQRFLSLSAETDIPCGAVGTITHETRLQTRMAPGGTLVDTGWTQLVRPIQADARFRGVGPIFFDASSETSIISADRGSTVLGFIYLNGSLGKNPTGQIVLPAGVELVDLELRSNSQTCERPEVISSQTVNQDGSTTVNVSLRAEGTTDGDWFFVESCEQTDCFPAGNGTLIARMYIDHTYPWENGTQAQFTASFDTENNTYSSGDPLEWSSSLLINVPNQQRLLIEPTCAGVGTIGDCSSSEPDGRTPGLEVTIENSGGELLTNLTAIIDIPFLGDPVGTEANTTLQSVANPDGLTIECFDGASWSATCDASAVRVRATLASAGPGAKKSFTLFLTVDPTAATGTKVFGTGSLTSNELPEVPASSITPIRVNLCPGALEASIFFDANQNGERDFGEPFLTDWLFDLTDERPETSTIAVDQGGQISVALARGAYTWDVRREGDPTDGVFRVVDLPPPTPQVLNVCPDVVTNLEVPVICDCPADGDPCTDDVCSSQGACTYIPRTEPLPGVLDDTCDYVDDDCDGVYSEDWVAPPVADCPMQGGCSGTGGVTECNGNELNVYGCTYTGTAEVCDGLDNDCDWFVDEGLSGRPELCDGIDNNCDGVIDNGIFPAEVCDGVDNDCDGLIDAADPSFQGGTEQCDGVDNDCDGLVDLADPTMVLPPCTDPNTGGSLRGVCVGAVPTPDLCVTVDFGPPFGSFTYFAGCLAPQFLESAYYNHVTSDGRPGTYIDPFYEGDTCDGLDNDCDGSADENFASAPVDCGCGPAGSTQCINGLVVEVCPPFEPSAEICDGLDNDCDGLVDQLDSDLVVPDCESELGVCADRKKPLALCAGAQGWQLCGPADYAFVAFPDYRADDDCDGVDNDCDGVPDDGFDSYPLVCEGGCAELGTVDCVDGELVDTCELGESSPELCDGNDNDCDGLVDASDPGLTRVLCSEQRGVCNGAVKPLELCGGSAGWAVCDANDYAAHAFPAYAVNDAVCDGLDNDCDGAVDEEYVGQLQLCPQGSCQPVARDRCSQGNVVSGCEPTGPGCPTGPGNECEECDPEVALTVYGVAEDAGGVPRGSFRCTSSAAGLICDTDANGFLAITEALWCGP